MTKALNKLHARAEARTCPYCTLAIATAASRCPHCTAHVEPAITFLPEAPIHVDRIPRA